MLIYITHNLYNFLFQSYHIICNLHIGGTLLESCQFNFRFWKREKQNHVMFIDSAIEFTGVHVHVID